MFLGCHNHILIVTRPIELKHVPLKSMNQVLGFLRPVCIMGLGEEGGVVFGRHCLISQGILVMEGGYCNDFKASCELHGRIPNAVSDTGRQGIFPRPPSQQLQRPFWVGGKSSSLLPVSNFFKPQTLTSAQL